VTGKSPRFTDNFEPFKYLIYRISFSGAISSEFLIRLQIIFVFNVLLHVALLLIITVKHMLNNHIICNVSEIQTSKRQLSNIVLTLKESAMKTLKIIPVVTFTLMFIFITGFTSHASNPVMAPAENLQKVIKETLKYPEQAIKNGYTGSVDVIFTVDEEGKINIKNTYADNPEIEKIVKEQLARVCCKGVKTPTNEHYKITITFKFIG
jgi:hypothetical protein